MPRRDGTGPSGAGPATGRQMGYCTNANPSGFGFFGRGRGFRQRFFQNDSQYYSSPSEKTIIEENIGFLKNQIKVLSERLANLNKED